ncbi:hypothetical protein DHD08_04675 [Arenibacter sp. H213]|nr:hypothetical protein [Arenibacter sp. H213]
MKSTGFPQPQRPGRFHKGEDALPDAFLKPMWKPLDLLLKEKIGRKLLVDTTCEAILIRRIGLKKLRDSAFYFSKSAEFLNRFFDLI